MRDGPVWKGGGGKTEGLFHPGGTSQKEGCLTFALAWGWGVLWPVWGSIPLESGPQVQGRFWRGPWKSPSQDKCGLWMLGTVYVNSCEWPREREEEGMEKCWMGQRELRTLNKRGSRVKKDAMALGAEAQCGKEGSPVYPAWLRLATVTRKTSSKELISASCKMGACRKLCGLAEEQGRGSGPRAKGLTLPTAGAAANGGTHGIS